MACPRWLSRLILIWGVPLTIVVDIQKGVSMLRKIRDVICRSFDTDSAWWGLRRDKPASDRPFTSKVLFLVCLAYGVPVAGMVWAFATAAAELSYRRNPLVDLRDWLPRAAAWAAFVLLSLFSAIGAWCWNLRARSLIRSDLPRSLDDGR